MTTHYLDLTLLPNPEIIPQHLLGALFDHLHTALVQRGEDHVGISFPGYSLTPRTLGSVLRLHGPEASLRTFDDGVWLKGMRDFVRVNTITPTPTQALHRTVYRKQFKTSVARLRRRRMQRKGETAEQAAKAIPATVQRNPKLPYVHVHSRSTAQPFCLFVAMGETAPQPTPGTFDRYGLSGTTTIPWF